MSKTFITYLAAIVTGILIARFAIPATTSVNTSANIETTTPTSSFIENDFDPADLIKRLEESEEKYQAINNELQQLKNNLTNNLVVDDSEANITTENNDPLAAAPNFIRERIEQNRRNNDPEYQREQLLNAGFSESELAAIEQAKIDFDQRRLNDRLQAMRENPDAYANTLDPFGYQTIRESLGDERFEDYLNTLGRDTSVNTRSVMPGSAAAQAGMQAGDQIYSYDGNRVFQAGDITRGTISGNLGENIIIEVLRNDSLLPLTVERGALGVILGNQGRGGRQNGGRGSR